MALPRKLKHLNLFNDGNNWQGIVESLTLPKFTRKYEKYRGGGMPGAVDVDLGLDDSALDTEFSIGGTELLLFKQMGKPRICLQYLLRDTLRAPVMTPAKRVHRVILMRTHFHQISSTVQCGASCTRLMAQRASRHKSPLASASSSPRFTPDAVAS